jgi:hypothetical protein
MSPRPDQTRPDQTSSIWTSEQWRQQKNGPDANQCRTAECHKSRISLAPTCEVCFADRKDTENQRKVDPNPPKRSRNHAASTYNHINESSLSRSFDFKHGARKRTLVLMMLPKQRTSTNIKDMKSNAVTSLQFKVTKPSMEWSRTRIPFSFSNTHFAFSSTVLENRCASD